MKPKTQKFASRLTLHCSLILCSLLTVHCSLNAQQYGWVDISGNLPDFYNDTVIINDGADTLIANISGISFLDDNHGWISTYHPFDGEPSAVLETTDGGQNWTEHSAPYTGADIHMIDELNGYFGAINGFIYKTTNGAQSWTLHGLLAAPLYDLGFPPRPAQNGFAGGKDGHLAQISPEGVFPVDLGLAGSVYCIDFPSEERGYALLDYQMIIYYLDEEWHVEASYPFSSKDWLYFRNDTVGWCVGEMFLKTIVGIDWYRTDPEFVQTGAMMGVYFTDLNNGWAVGTQGQIAYSNDGGEDWTMLEHHLTDEILTGVLFTSPTNGYIIGGEKTLLKYTELNGEPETGGQGDREKGSVEVFPNPTRGKFQIISTKHQTNSKFKIPNSKLQVEVVDLFGKPVAISPLHRMGEGPGVGAGTLEFDLTGCPAGIYFLCIHLENQTIVRKIIKL
ncbi:MAG TPA: YCF48-related protein [Bacteroidales bacterium]|nr:YCF48-related protein [Bacteroidales bacterium]HPM91917.1 YCF48-related protein [Bacteroidales bacterium]